MCKEKHDYFLVFPASFTALSQQKTIEITNFKSGKTIIFEENQRIKKGYWMGKNILETQ